MAGVFAVALVLFVLNSDLSDAIPYAYMFPWLLGLTAVFGAPVVYLYYKGRFEVYDPLIFAVGSYLFPAFVVGGFMLMMGWSNPYYLNMIQDPTYNLPYTVVLIMLGFGGLAAGYFVPIGRLLGGSIEKRLPTWEFEPISFILPGIVLLGFGLANVIVALAMGIIGYQRPGEVGAFDGLIFVTTSLWVQATFLIMYVLFRRKNFDLLFFLVSVPLLLASVSKALFSGNRGTMLHIVFIFGLAFFMSGVRMTLRKGIWTAIIVMVALFAGMIYGSTFRSVKGSEDRVSMDRFADDIATTIENVGNTDLASNLSFGFSNLALRLDSLSSVAVVVSSYEELAPYEESFGLDNNIWRDLSTFLIPRFIWKDKPVESDARRYSDLYFNYSESSFVFTPIGDLLRNFGPIGVPLGMFILGMIIRTFYRALVEDQKPITWRIVLYFMLLSAVSYEAFYSTMIPNITKYGVTAVIGTLIVYVTARLLGYKKLSGATDGGSMSPRTAG